MIPFATLSNIWTKADGPYTYQGTFILFSFNDNLYSYASGGDGIYSLNDKNLEWQKLDTGFFVDKGTISHYDQKDNVIMTSTIEGVYWSYDYGETWKFSDKRWKGNSLGFPSVTIDDQTIYVQSYNNSLYKLEKDSEIFEKIYTDKTKTDSVFADVLIIKDNIFIAANLKNNNGELQISKDNGEIWKFSASINKEIRNIILHNDILFAFTKEDELYKSTDYGDTWTTDTSLTIRGEKVISYKDLIIASSNQLFASSDNGDSWESISDGIDFTRSKDIIVNSDELFYLTNRNLIYRLNYEERKWTLISPIREEGTQNVIIEERDTLFSTGGFTVNYSVDNGESWDVYSDSLYFNYTAYRNLFVEDSIFIALSSTQSSLRISTDNGKSWRFENIGHVLPYFWIQTILIMDNRILLSSHVYGNYISEDAGLTWNKYKNEVIEEDEFIYTSIRLSDNEIILYSEKGLYKTFDNGLTWEYEEAVEEIKAYSTTVREGNNLYSIDIENRIYKSTDLGRTWNDLVLNLDPDINFISLKVYNGYLILLTTTNVFVSSNDGKDWIEYQVELLTPEGKDLYFNNGIVSGDYLVLTSDYGIWRAKLSDLGIEVKSSVEADIDRNYLYTYPPYPNPAKYEVKVHFYWDINLPMNVDDIRIYDITGKNIPINNNIRLEKQTNYKGNIVWDCSSVLPGIYIINIKHGTEEKAVKVVVE